MVNTAKLQEIKTYRLENWVKILGDIYSNADSGRNASSLWLDVIEGSSIVAEYVRREEYNKAIGTIPDVFGRVLSFVAKYSINATDDLVRNEGIDLGLGDHSGYQLTYWVLKKYPGVCSVCAKKPCVCPSTRYEWETRHEHLRVAATIAVRLEKNANWEREVEGKIGSYDTEALFNMFGQIYSGVLCDPPISAICFHFLEEVGEVAKLLQSFDNIQILKASNNNNVNGSYEDNLKHLNADLKAEISDVVSWTMSLINKFNFIFRATYPHHQCLVDQLVDQKESPKASYSQIALSELLLNRFYDGKLQKFVCPYCKSQRCSPKCKQDRLLKEVEDKIKKEEQLMHEVRKVMGHEKRKSPRETVDIKGTVDSDNDSHVVNMGKDNIGFLSNASLSLNERRVIVLKRGSTEEFLEFKVARPANADPKTGFKYFYGAELLGGRQKSLSPAALPN